MPDLAPIILPPPAALGLIRLYSAQVLGEIKPHKGRNPIAPLTDLLETTELRITGNLDLNEEKNLIFPSHVSILGDFYLGERQRNQWLKAPKLLECLAFRVLIPNETPMPETLKCLRVVFNTNLKGCVSQRDLPGETGATSRPWTGTLHTPPHHDGIQTKAFLNAIKASGQLIQSPDGYPSFLHDTDHLQELAKAPSLSYSFNAIYDLLAKYSPDYDFLSLAGTLGLSFPKNQAYGPLNYVPLESLTNPAVLPNVREYITDYPESAVALQVTRRLQHGILGMPVESTEMESNLDLI